MTIYSSKTPRDLNRDPLPFTSHHGRHEDADPAGWDFDVEFTYAPRPEFDPSKAHNEPNPILIEFREDRRGDVVMGMTLANSAVYSLRTCEPDWWEPDEGVTPEHCHHARKVLTRLANPAKVES